MSGKASIIIDGNSVGALKAINDVSEKINGFKSLSSNFGSSFTQFFSNPINAGVAVIGGFITSMTALTQKVANTADEMVKAAQKTGTTTEQLSTLKYAADLSGVSFEQLQKGMIRLAQSSEITTLGTNDTGEALKLVADRISKMPDGFQKTAEATRIFGRDGANLIPLLNSGAEGLKQLQKEAKLYGLEIGTNTAKQAEVFNDNMSRLKSVVTGFGTQIGLQLVPAFAQVSNAMVAYVSEGNKAKDVSVLISGAMKAIITVGIALAETVQLITNLWGNFGALIYSILTGNFDVAANIFENFKKNTIDKFIDGIKSIGAVWDTTNQQIAGGTKTAEQIAAEQEVAQKAAQARANQMDQALQKMQDTINKANLSPLGYEFNKLSTEIDNLRSKFPELADTIDRYYFAKLKDLKIATPEAIKEINLSTAQIGDFNSPLQPISAAVTDQINAQYELQKQKNLEITADEAMAYAVRQQGFSDMLGNMNGVAEQFYAMSGQQSAEAFAVMKAFQIGQAVMNTYSSAVAAYNSLVGIPLVGPGLAAAAAAAAVAFGLANVARIASSQPGSRGAGAVSAPSAPSAASAPVGTAGGGNNAYVNVSINGNVFDRDGFVREIMPGIQKAIGDGFNIVVTGG